MNSHSRPTPAIHDQVGYHHSGNDDPPKQQQLSDWVRRAEQRAEKNADDDNLERKYNKP
jgi:hypothetical protein